MKLFSMFPPIVRQHFLKSANTVRNSVATVSLNKKVKGNFFHKQSGSLSNLSDLEAHRNEIAPWIPIGTFRKSLLSHLSTFDIIRSMMVLHFCSYDFFVERSMDMFNLSTKFGLLGEWIVRKTFFNQFVGGDKIHRMAEVVQSMQKRGLRLMVLPVLEEDVEDVKSAKKIYDDNINSLLDIATMTSLLEKRKPMLQLKLSAIMPPNTLEEVSKIILSKCTTKAQLAQLVEELANSIDNPSALSINLDPINRSYFLDGLQRADLLIKKAEEVSINVLTDAEFYSCKPAISTIALALMARYNQRQHLVGTTIQGYLKEAVATTRSELEIVTKLIGVNWYGKVVRGAYMDRERYLAIKQNRASPVCDSYEDTNLSYNTVVQEILTYLANPRIGDQSHLVVASHNELSIRIAAQSMKSLGIQNNSKSVSFAQIYGMGDYLSSPLVEQGYEVYKSTPYGPIGKVLPYLARRASENRSVIKGAREESYMLKKELMNRMLLRAS